jgi:hypothetical protein
LGCFSIRIESAVYSVLTCRIILNIRDSHTHGVQTEIHAGSHDEPAFSGSVRITNDRDMRGRATWSDTPRFTPHLEPPIEMTRTFKSFHQDADDENSPAGESKDIFRDKDYT